MPCLPPAPSVPTPPWFLPISSSHSYVRHRTTQIVCFSVFCFVSFCLLSAALEAALAHPHACVCLSLCLSVCVAVPVCVCVRLCMYSLRLCYVWPRFHVISQVYTTYFKCLMCLSHPTRINFLTRCQPPAPSLFLPLAPPPPPPSYSPPTPALFCQLFIFCIIRGGNSIKT